MQTCSPGLHYMEGARRFGVPACACVQSCKAHFCHWSLLNKPGVVDDLVPAKPMGLHATVPAPAVKPLLQTGAQPPALNISNRPSQRTIQGVARRSVCAAVDDTVENMIRAAGIRRSPMAVLGGMIPNPHISCHSWPLVCLCPPPHTHTHMRPTISGACRPHRSES